MGVEVVVVGVEAAGDDGAEAMDEAADAGLKFNKVFTSNFRFRSRLKVKILLLFQRLFFDKKKFNN